MASGCVCALAWRGNDALSPGKMKGFEPVKMIAVAVAERTGDFKARQPAEEDRQGDLELEAGKRCPDAEVNAGAEAHMRVGSARGIESIRFAEACRIAIGGAEQQADGFALLQVNAGDIDILERIAGEEMKR